MIATQAAIVDCAFGGFPLDYLFGCTVKRNFLRLQEIQLNSAPTAVLYCPMSRDVLNQHPTRKEVFVGLADGTLHQLFLDSSTHHFATTLTPPASEHAAAITQIYSGFDSANDGLDDVVVGREGGKVEIYHMDAFGQLIKVRHHSWASAPST